MAAMKTGPIACWKTCLSAVLLIALLQSTQAVDWYVATNGAGHGTNGWANATNSLQGAINISAVNDTIWVSNGLYADGGVTNYPAGSSLTNRVAIWKSITVRSKDNDPTNTIIKGAWDAPSTTNGPAAVRCVFMASNSVLIGFTLTNGATLTNGTADLCGGGVYCPNTNPILTNCVLIYNRARGSYGNNYGGGGAWYGTLRNCILSGNFAQNGGGARSSTLYNCLVISNTVNGTPGTYPEGGGAYFCTLYNCILKNNTATIYQGGGASGGALYNCLLIGNYAGYYGSAAHGATLYNCTAVGNSAASGCGAVDNSKANNCIVYFNTPINWANSPVYTNSCTTPLPTGTGNTTNNPMFIDKGNGYGMTNIAGNYRLLPGSPCIDTGTNFSWMTNPADARSKDLDGRWRLKYGIVDMGAYEHIHAGTIYDVY